MSKAAAHTIGLIRLELQDLQEDLRIMEQTGLERYKNLEITEYVMKENNALFEGEILALKSLEKLLTQEKWKNYTDTELLLGDFEAEAVHHLNHHQYALAVHQIIKRKLAKVRDFLMSDG